MNTNDEEDVSIQSDFLSVVRWLHDHKRLAAWVSYGLLTSSILLLNWVPQLFPVCAVLYLSVVTAVLMDIHKRTKPTRTVLPSHSEANLAFHEEIRRALAEPGRCEMAWLGVTMQSAWLTLENTLGKAIQSRKASDLHIRLLQSDPAYLESILDDGDKQPAITRQQADYIKAFCERHDQCLRATGSTIELSQYAYMPNIHGLLINDSVLFLSYVRWTDSDLSDLSVPHEPFERFDRSTERGQYMIKLFKSWLEKGFLVASSSLCFPPEIKPVSTQLAIESTSESPALLPSPAELTSPQSTPSSIDTSILENHLSASVPNQQSH